MKRAVMAILATLTLTMGTSATYATPIETDMLDHGFTCPVQEVYASLEGYYGYLYGHVRAGTFKLIEIEAWHRHGELEMATYKNADVVALDPSIASIMLTSDGSNFVVGHAPGMARFIATYGGIAHEFEVVVD